MLRAKSDQKAIAEKSNSNEAEKGRFDAGLLAVRDAGLERLPFPLAHGTRSSSLFESVIHRFGDSTCADHALAATAGQPVVVVALISVMVLGGEPGRLGVRSSGRQDDGGEGGTGQGLDPKVTSVCFIRHDKSFLDGLICLLHSFARLISIPERDFRCDAVLDRLAQFPFPLARGTRSSSLFESVIHRFSDSTCADHALYE
jgi:hypothetical protein